MSALAEIAALFSAAASTFAGTALLYLRRVLATCAGPACKVSTRLIGRLERTPHTILAVGTTSHLLYGERIPLLDWSSSDRARKSKSRGKIGEGRHIENLENTDDVKQESGEQEDVNHESEDSCRMKKIQDMRDDLALYQAFQDCHKARQQVRLCLHRCAPTLYTAVTPDPLLVHVGH